MGAHGYGEGAVGEAEDDPAGVEERKGRRLRSEERQGRNPPGRSFAGRREGGAGDDGCGGKAYFVEAGGEGEGCGCGGSAPSGAAV